MNHLGHDADLHGAVTSTQPSMKQNDTTDLHISDIEDGREVDENDDVMNVQQLRLVLESVGVFLTHDELESVFNTISNGESETIALKQLVAFAASKQRLISGREKQQAILQRCKRNVSFWTSFAYVVGSVPYIIQGLLSGPNWLLLNLGGLGSLLYFIGAAGGMINVYNSVLRSIASMDRVHARLRAAAVKLGTLSRLFNHKCIRQSILHAVKDQQIS